jgi:SAM-dependent methyltransferase
MAGDERARIYDDLHHDQLGRERESNRASARKILGILLQFARPGSVLDVGCGLGTWLATARELGVHDVRGVDGDWVDDAMLDVEPAVVCRCDLEQGVSLDRRFDLVISLEVAEHLDARAADSFVASLVRHGDMVLFSAAIPSQGGHHHVNEQFPEYWAERFARHGYRPLDIIRPRIWSDRSVLGWLRQNILVYVNERALERYPALRDEASPPRMLSVVLPELYMARASEAKEYEKLQAVLSAGGNFHVSKGADGRLTIRKVRGLLRFLTGG